MHTMIKRYTLLISAIALSVSLVACDSSDQAPAADGMQEETAIEHAEKHFDPKYVCPMHSNIVQDEPGNCPICGMTLVEKEAEKPKEKKILYWVAPMDPNFRQEGPGKSPMGMDLIPFYGEEGGDDNAITISPAIVQNLGVRTAKAERGKLWKRVDTVGYVDFDENRISHVHLRTEGWINTLVVKSQGARVKKGDLLFELYSPTLVNAQDEYLQALRSNNQRLLAASHDRLRALGVDEQQIDMIKKTRKAEQLIKIRASQDGIVAKLNAREGMFVKPQMEIMALADLSTIWIQVEVFERQANWVKAGKPAEITVSYLPGRTWEGTVEYVYPSLDPKTRTLRARLRFENPDESLKPNMFVNVTVFGGAEQDVVSIPREALIRTGEGERVIISLGEGRFVPRDVVSGIESGGRVEIRKGLKGHEEVVTSAQFLLDSEASIKAGLNRMSEPETQTDMDMQENMPDSKTITGKGVLRELMPDEKKINVSHEPIPALGWPDMTMDFRVDEAVSLEGLQPGQVIEFDMVEKDDTYIIEAIRPVAE
ncbi:efflux RND transporter periplasmic adaptor subunit [Sulfuriflexus sp.]|uniref:efflux RND transporter periplasmic adaptor subunit n=1 Tax=Sulfuriflexus sp. TaxID=2015443 RepID=UPI0028CD8387|nr:efflux RND transporter periplasmic adaptor subunit [Sulfuriflexus sp.]MDT8403085.1 efflux RND transporter periplasmic adaptor subunit [Sulfuriflexus sp.]